jgi:hypothetical protein
MRILSLLLVPAALACAQEATAQPKNTQVLIDVKYADVNRLSTLLANTFGARVSPDASLHVIGVSGPPDLVAAVTAAIKKLDVPPSPQPNVELTVYLISGLAQGQGTDDVPMDLAATIKQLRGLFAYKSYKLADTLVVRGRVGDPSLGGNSGQTEGVLPGTNLRYNFAYFSLSVSAETPRTVHVRNLSLVLRGARTTPQKEGPPVTEYSDTPARISTDLDVKEGQKTVVGKSSINQAGDALILVIVPKIMD